MELVRATTQVMSPSRPRRSSHVRIAPTELSLATATATPTRRAARMSSTAPGVSGALGIVDASAPEITCSSSWPDLASMRWTDCTNVSASPSSGIEDLCQPRSIKSRCERSRSSAVGRSWKASAIGPSKSRMRAAGFASGRDVVRRFPRRSRTTSAPVGRSVRRLCLERRRPACGTGWRPCP